MTNKVVLAKNNYKCYGPLLILGYIDVTSHKKFYVIRTYLGLYIFSNESYNSLAG